MCIHRTKISAMTVHLLAIETSGNACSVALVSCRADGPISVTRAEHEGIGQHAERLLPMADSLLAERGIGRQVLSAVAFGQGPGGFTGLRVACGVAQGMAFALEIPVVPVDSLMAVAHRDRQGAPEGFGDHIRVVVQDARMSELYVAAYAPREQGWDTLQGAMLLGSSDLTTWLEHVSHERPGGLSLKAGVRLVGDGVHLCPGIDDYAQSSNGRIVLGPPLRPDAVAVGQLAVPLFRLGRHVPPELAAPLYVRDKVAFTTDERKQGMGGNPKAPGLGIALRPMGAHDVHAVAAIEASVQQFPWTPGNFSDGLKAGYSGWVAHRNGQVVGFSMTMFAPDVAHLLVIAVAPELHGEGIGTALIRHCETEARARDLPALLLEVRPSNTKALSFYKRHGFEQIATRRDYYPAPGNKREDACVMRKPLTAVA